MPTLSLLSLISRNSPKRLGMVSPELRTRSYPCGGDIGWPDDVPTVALEVLSHCALATTYLLQG